VFQGYLIRTAASQGMVEGSRPIIQVLEMIVTKRKIHQRDMQGQDPLLRDQRFACDSFQFSSSSANAMMESINTDLGFSLMLLKVGLLRCLFATAFSGESDWHKAHRI
jgi:hypothetical protein